MERSRDGYVQFAQGLFDEWARILQSARTMRLLTIMVVLAGAGGLVHGETNAPAEIRKMSLEDCVQAALEKNLDLRIARLTVPQALADLQGAFAGWDPTLTTSGE